MPFQNWVPKPENLWSTKKLGLYILMCIPATLPAAFLAFNQVFISAVPKHWCTVSTLVAHNLTVSHIMNLSIPQVWRFIHLSYFFKLAAVKEYHLVPNVTHVWFIRNFFPETVSQRKHVFYMKQCCEKVPNEPRVLHLAPESTFHFGRGTLYPTIWIPMESLWKVELNFEYGLQNQVSLRPRGPQRSPGARLPYLVFMDMLHGGRFLATVKDMWHGL